MCLKLIRFSFPKDSLYLRECIVFVVLAMLKEEGAKIVLLHSLKLTAYQVILKAQLCATFANKIHHRQHVEK